MNDASQSFSALMLSCLCLHLIGCGGGPPDNTYQPPPPPEIEVANPVQQTIVVFLEETGETEAVEYVDVRARVKGFLEEIRFEPGQKVKQGDVIYIIEKDEFQAAYDSAVAAVDVAAAAVEVAKSQVGLADVEITRSEREYARMAKLKEQNVATQSEIDQALSEKDAAIANRKSALASVDAAEADLEQAKANLEQAKLELGYTEVKAPIDGRISKTEIKLGNLVEEGSVLSTIVDRDEIYANFNLTDRLAMQLKQQYGQEGDAADEPSRWHHVPVLLRREIDSTDRFTGNLDYVDQRGVDQSTGTLAIRAKFKNEEDDLLAGLFVNVRVPIEKVNDALLVPEEAVFRDQKGTYVLVIGEGDKVARRDVTRSNTYSGMVHIDSGLSATDRVILNGSQRVRKDMQIVPKPVTLSPVEMPEIDIPEMPEETDPKSESDKADASSDQSEPDTDSSPSAAEDNKPEADDESQSQ